MNIYEILIMKLFTIILGHLQGILPYKNLVRVGRGIALEIADTQKMSGYLCMSKKREREKKKKFFCWYEML